MNNAGFLNYAMGAFIDAINGNWQPWVMIYGARLFLAVAVLAFGVDMVASLMRRDFMALLDGLLGTIIGIGVLFAIFMHGIEWAGDLQATFETIAQSISGESVGVLTPSGVLTQGFVTWDMLSVAAGHASWYMWTFAELSANCAGAIVAFCYLCCAIILLLCEVELAAYAVGGCLLLALASLPWTRPMLGRWALTILSLSIKLFGLLAVIGLGLILAAGWATTLAGLSINTASAEAIFGPAFESILLVMLTYTAPNGLASLVAGGNGSGFGFGEQMLRSGGSSVGNALGSGAGSAGAGAAQGAAQSAAATAAKVQSMLVKS